MEDATRMFANNIVMIAEENRVECFDDQEENEYVGSRQSIREYVPPASPLMSPNVSRQGSLSVIDDNNKSMTLNRPNDGNDIENASVNSTNRVGRIWIKPTHFVSPFISPLASRNNSLKSRVEICNNGSGSNKSHVSGDIESALARTNIGGGGIDMDNNMRIKPNNSMTNPSSRSNSIVPLDPPLSNNNNEISNAMGSLGPPLSNDCANLNSIDSLGPPLNDNNIDHSMIDHVPLARHNSLQMNLANYETAHLLSDKIVVVFVQVTSLNHLSQPTPIPS